MIEDAFKPVGDLNGNNVVSIDDATVIQQFLAEFTTDGGDPLLDENDALALFLADSNDDDRISIKDVTEIQRFLAEFISEIGYVPVFVR